MKLIYITCKNETEAKKIATSLLQKKFIACANYFPTRSIYRWKGKIQNEKETVLLLKTVKPFLTIKKEVEKIHSYEIPCIEEIDIKNVNTKYYDWVLEQLH